jgi:putative endonuclease
VGLGHCRLVIARFQSYNPLILQSSPPRVNSALRAAWGYSSVGRAVALQATGQGFESPCLHQSNSLFFVYILFSQSRQRFYVGSTADINDRLQRHNAGRSVATKAGAPWELVYTETFSTRSGAVCRELEIKSWKSAHSIRSLVGEHPA